MKEKNTREQLIMKSFLLITICLCACLAVQAQSPTPSPPQYSITDINGSLDSSTACCINNAAQVAGTYADPALGSSSIAFRYSDGTVQSLGTFTGGNTSTAAGINSSGQVTGYAATQSGDSHAFVWSGGPMQDLGTLGGTSSSGFGINDAGTVVGDALDGQHNYYQAIIYSGGVMTSLGLSPGSQSFANAINAAEQITGSMGVNFQDHAFLYSNGSAQDLGVLGAGYNSYGRGINAEGDVTGFGELATYNRHAFLYSSGSGMQDLGTLSGGAYDESFANAINNSSQVTGNSDTGTGTRAGFLFTGGVMYDLNSLVPADSGVTNIQSGIGGSSQGNAINDFGQIAATGTSTVDGHQHALILTPVPASSTTTVSANSSYETAVAPVTNSNTPNATTVALVDGTASSDQTVQISFDSSLPPSSSTFQAASDPVSVSGTGSDTFVLQISYNEAQAISVFGSEDNVQLMWLDPSDNQWKLAVAGNTGGTPTAVQGPYDPNTDFQLGYYGVDTVNNVVWAVINHNSQFVVSGNQAPVVNAGPDQTITTPRTTLVGSAIDDGLPNPPGALTYSWTKVSGPGKVKFANVNSASTTATFGKRGSYTLMLTASDGALSSSDTVVIDFNRRR